MQILNDEEKEKNVKPAWGYLEYWVKHLKQILSFQYCKIIREQSENAEVWMSYLRMKANECKCKEKIKY